MNSFRAVEKAIDYEAKRQMEALEYGEEIIQETRTWDEEKQVTRSMRSKEEAHDYRYFPEPDLPPLKITPEWIEEIQASLPEMPDQARGRLMEQYGLSEYDASIITQSPDYLAFFDECLRNYSNAKTVANWMMGELSRLLNQNNMEISECLVKPEDLIKLLGLIDNGTISGKMAKTVFEEMFAGGKKPELIIKEKGMEQISDEGTLKAVIEEVVANNQKVLQDYKNGKKKAFGFFVGQVMKATKGQADPSAVNKLLRERLDK